MKEPFEGINTELVTGLHHFEDGLHDVNKNFLDNKLFSDLSFVFFGNFDKTLAHIENSIITSVENQFTK